VEAARGHRAEQEPGRADAERADQVPGDVAHGPLGAQALGLPLLRGEAGQHVGRPAALGRDQREDLVGLGPVHDGPA